MNESAFSLRAEAQILAEQLQGLQLQVQAADTLYPGAASRKRAGSGEQFWQYRHYTQTDAADRIDWRRSARTDDHFVRETELETARTVLFWCDPETAFSWSGSAERPTKAERAKVIMLSLGILIGAAGERIGALGASRPPRSGKAAANRLAEDLSVPASPHPHPPRGKSIMILASDFYQSADSLAATLQNHAQSCRRGILLRVTDPVEHNFPYAGRTRFHRPGSDTSQIFGRAETVRDAYLEKFHKHSEGLRNVAIQAGWTMVEHRTDSAPIDGASALFSAVIALGQI